MSNLRLREAEVIKVDIHALGLLDERVYPLEI